MEGEKNNERNSQWQPAPHGERLHPAFSSGHTANAGSLHTHVRNNKGSTLGIGLVLLGTILFWQDFGIASRAIAIIVFLFLTAPVAAHVIGRAAYLGKVPLWEKTNIDEFKKREHPSDSSSSMPE